MQKWEYAYIDDYSFTSRHDPYVSLTYLHPDKPITETFKKKGGFFKRPAISEYSEQRNAWITKLGQEGYEMTGLELRTLHGSSTHIISWFKRPFPYV
jgi:hypothetical protein